ncbi:HNH endonuclease [Streptomyces noursei]|uniref:HNH endonuclease n=2 Tax=Streptomyces TaxID=1883 RepID=UPI0030F1AD84
MEMDRMVQAADRIGKQRTGSGVGRPTDRTEEAGIQWVLQPRGGAKRRGPQHFQRSVREGIRLDDYRHVLGDHEDELRRIFPTGVARLWGATPTEEAGNAKAVALRGRRVGDEVLFYGEKKFLARARILSLLRSRPLAEAIWGVDEAGRTWEHVMALGDVVEFEAWAEPVLTGLGITPPLRSLTLVQAADRLRLAGLLTEECDGSRKPAPGTTPEVRTQAPQLGRDQLLRALGSLNRHVQPQGRSRHKPLALLWAIGQVASRKSRLAPWETFRREVGVLLEEFGLAGSQVTPEYPFWHLRTSGVWEVHGIEHDDFKPTPAALRSQDARAGFGRDAARLLTEPLTRVEAVMLLCSTYFQDTDHDELLERVGLGGYLNASGQSVHAVVDKDRPKAPVGRREVTSSRQERDRRLAQDIKVLHRHQCQVCGIRLETLLSHYSEAAHIRGLGSPHDGPDELANLLCLCPNHHIQFDRLAIYIDENWQIRRTRDNEVLGELIRNPEHAIDADYLAYHRHLCRMASPTVRS